MSQFFASGGQSIGVSASTSVLPMNIQDWFPLGWTCWIALQSKGLSRIYEVNIFCVWKKYICISAKTLTQAFEWIYLGAGLDPRFSVVVVMLSELVFILLWYYIEFNVGANLPENIFQCTLHPPAWGPQHALCLREGVCLAIYLLLHACWLCHRGRDVLCSKCLSGRYASWVLESWPSLCWPLSQHDSLHLWERIVPVSFSQLQWVFTGAPGECPGLPFPSPVKAFVSGGDGDRGTSGFAPPAVSAHPVHQHRGRLPGVS